MEKNENTQNEEYVYKKDESGFSYNFVNGEEYEDEEFQEEVELKNEDTTKNKTLNQMQYEELVRTQMERIEQRNNARGNGSEIASLVIGILLFPCDGVVLWRVMYNAIILFGKSRWVNYFITLIPIVIGLYGISLCKKSYYQRRKLSGIAIAGLVVCLVGMIPMIVLNFILLTTCDMNV